MSESTKQRLLRWARWREDGPQMGYGATVLGRMIEIGPEAIISLRSAHRQHDPVASVRDDSEAEETEAAVRLLQAPHQRLIRARYLGDIDGRKIRRAAKVSEKAMAELLGLQRSTYYTSMDKALVALEAVLAVFDAWQRD